eukprot:2013627-Pyramimonas_sp.AAC.1
MDVPLESSHASMLAAPVDAPAVLGLAQIPGSALQGCCAVQHTHLSLARGRAQYIMHEILEVALPKWALKLLIQYRSLQLGLTSTQRQSKTMFLIVVLGSM